MKSIRLINFKFITNPLFVMNSEKFIINPNLKKKKNNFELKQLTAFFTINDTMKILIFLCSFLLLRSLPHQIRYHSRKFIM